MNLHLSLRVKGSELSPDLSMQPKKIPPKSGAIVPLKGL